MADWAEVWALLPDDDCPLRVLDAEGTIEPEEWVRDHGVKNYPDAIYFFATLEPLRFDISGTPKTYEEIINAAAMSDAFRAGLLAAADVCRSQGQDPSKPPCPSTLAAVYIDRLANGMLP